MMIIIMFYLLLDMLMVLYYHDSYGYDDDSYGYDGMMICVVMIHTLLSCIVM